MSLESTPMHTALTRPLLLAGVERKPFSLLLIGSLSLPFFAENMALLLVTVPAAIAAIAVLRIVNKGDPQWVGVYQRSIRYQDFYPAKAHFTGKIEHNWSKPFG